MKTLTLILVLFSFVLTAQNGYVYKLKFADQQTAAQVLDSTITKAKVSASIIGYSYFRNDSTAIYEDGIFYDVISPFPIDKLNKYIIDPYPTKFNHCFAGVDETNAVFVRKE